MAALPYTLLILGISLYFCCAEERTCEPITIPLCRDVGYNLTTLPNLLGHTTQTDAGLEVTTYHSLIKIGCSPYLQTFLCSLYLPKCSEKLGRQLIPPCRNVCEEAKAGCAELMMRFGHDWPEHMNCKRFPRNGSSTICIDKIANLDTASIASPRVTPGVTPRAPGVTPRVIPGVTRRAADWKIIEESTTPQSPAEERTCEPITIPLCRDVGYNLTRLPNLLHHTTQTEAGLEVTTYHPLIKIGCSPYMRTFLCSLYLPMCSEKLGHQIIPPCRNVCEKAKAGCAPLMTKFGHDWPEHMNCERFPRNGPSTICIDKDNASIDSPRVTLGVTSRVIPDVTPRVTPRIIPRVTPGITRRAPGVKTTEESTAPQSPAVTIAQSGKACTLKTTSITLPPQQRRVVVQLEPGRIKKLASGTHIFKVRDADNKTCSKIVSIRKSKGELKSRLEIRASYEVDCKLMADDYTKALVEAAADHHSAHVKDICGTKCSAKTSVKPRILCSGEKMIITWATSLRYRTKPGKKVRLPARLGKELNKRLRRKGAMMMMVFPNRMPPFVFPTRSRNGSSATLMLTSFCSEKGCL